VAPERMPASERRRRSIRRILRSGAAWAPRRFWFALGIFAAGLTCIVNPLGRSAYAQPDEAKLDAARRNTAKHYDEHVRPFLARHCLECHRGEKPKGDLRLDQLVADFDGDAGRKPWRLVLERIAAGEMPPKEKPRPEEKELQQFAAWINGNLGAAEAAERAAQGRVVLRRLNRAEYENTVRDLLGVNVHLKELLPLDSSSGSIGNVATPP